MRLCVSLYLFNVPSFISGGISIKPSKDMGLMRGDMEDPAPFISAHEQAELEAKALVQELRS